MRDLSVYYCSQCGFYAYYQLPKNAICHRCDIAMTLIEMRYQDFMNLDYEQRDKLINRLSLLLLPTSRKSANRLLFTIKEKSWDA